MASQKNQHYVPKVHLRPFSVKGDGRSIHLYNIKGDRVVLGASLRHQCSDDYFYGDDKALENLFGQLEGSYADVVRKIEAGTFGPDEYTWARMFMVTQSCRTKAAMQEAREFHEKAASVSLRGKTIKEQEKPGLSDKQMLFAAMRRMRTIMGWSLDLDMIVVKNRTPVSFVTSDNPLVHVNRLHQQQIKRPFGVASAGAMMFMPVSPRYLLALTDRGAYSVNDSDGYIDAKKIGDIQAFNAMQFLNADENIYFGTSSEAEDIKNLFNDVRNKRPAERVKMVEMIEEVTGPGFTKYKRIETKEEEDAATAKLISSRFIPIAPPSWPSIFSIRNKPKMYGEKSNAMGFLRKPEWVLGYKPEF